MSTHQTLTFCADDYGLAPGVSHAIRALIEQGRLHATSCMTGSPHWPDAATAIRPLAPMAQIGLHVTLTDQTPLTRMPKTAPHGKLPTIQSLIINAHLGRLDHDEIEAEITAQVDAFITHFGRAPDYLDGHQHAHELPIIQDILLDVWAGPMNRRGWIRNCWESPWALIARRIDPVRALIIGSMGLGLLAKMKRLGVPHNHSFRGIYDLTDRAPFAQLLERFIAAPKPQTLIMVHPGFVDDALRAVDPVTDQREREYAYLASEQFAQSLDRRGLKLGPLFSS